MAGDTLTFPLSDNTVRVRMLDTTCRFTINAESFIEPTQPGLECFEVPNAAFLVEHASSGQKLMFDLGIRKDYWNLPAVILNRLSTGIAIPNLRVDRDATEILQENGVALQDINTVVWSHYHWDHIGDVSLFPPSTSLVVGPGFKASPTLLPGHPEKPDSPVPSSAFSERELHEIDFSQSSLTIGGFRAYDFFSDGSFYLLDTPGHCIGHICGLARTTHGADGTFVLLGGDICHFAGCFRPSPTYPLPDELPSKALDKSFPCPCPATMFTDYHPQEASQDDRQTSPFYKISTKPNSAYVEPALAQESVHKLIAFDACASVLVCFAHDQSLPKYLPSLNNSSDADLNAWKADGLKDLCHWDWLNYLPKQGLPGRTPEVRGFWREGKPWPSVKEELRSLSGHVEGTGL